MTDETGLLILVLLCAAGFVYRWRRWRQPHSHARAVAAARQRLRRPRTAADCPRSRLHSAAPRAAVAPSVPVRLGREPKNPRGAPRRINPELTVRSFPESVLKIRPTGGRK